MQGIIGTLGSSLTLQPSLSAHVAHLRHLATPLTARRILKSRFGFSLSDARKSGILLSSHIRQALEFYEASATANPRVRPVLQYYAHLNLAVATILAYRPPNYSDFKRHGVRDRTSQLESLEISSQVAEIGKGAVPTFHRIFSGASLPKVFTMRTLLAAIPMVSTELFDVFKIRTYPIAVNESVPRLPNHGHWRSSLEFSIDDSVEPWAKNQRIPKAAIERSMPVLCQEYKREIQEAKRIVYASKKTWAAQQDAVKWHRETCRYCINFGGHAWLPPSALYKWRYSPRVAILPTMTATLVLGFALASIMRYRPQLAEKIEDSPINVLLQTFMSEADAYVIPTFRNLLYREERVFTTNVST